MFTLKIFFGGFNVLLIKGKIMNKLLIAVFTLVGSCMASVSCSNPSRPLGDDMNAPDRCEVLFERYRRHRETQRNDPCQRLRHIVGQPLTAYDHIRMIEGEWSRTCVESHGILSERFDRLYPNFDQVNIQG